MFNAQPTGTVISRQFLNDGSDVQLKTETEKKLMKKLGGMMKKKLRPVDQTLW